VKIATASKKPIRRLLVANRGEIAVRVMRACRDLGIESVAVYGPGEEHASHVRMANDAYLISAESGLPYLDIESLLGVAKRSECDAVHPGYGFLAEHSHFAGACLDAGLIFVGPPVAAISLMGQKIEARAVAREAGVPIVPGTDGAVYSAQEAAAVAADLGYPIAIKASAGGGGRGFRIASEPNDLDAAFMGSSGEAQRYFGDPAVYLERYFEEPRHVEIQIFADAHGQIVSLGERDCSVQRRHQKLIEESPSPAVNAPLREALGASAVALARAVGYENAGTVEFLLDKDGSYYFLEMNTRIQVEHTVTEEVTGIDLVKEQIQVAAGEPLSFREDEVASRSHAIEFRINAEEPSLDFKPVPGVISDLTLPQGFGVRVDTAAERDSEILSTYDSLIAKLIVRGRDREEALARSQRALDEFVVDGIPTTLSFHRLVVRNSAFRAGDFTTSFIVDHPEVIPGPSAVVQADVSRARGHSETVVEVDGRRFTVRVHGTETDRSAPIAPGGEPPSVPGWQKRRIDRSDGASLLSPIQGTLVRLAVSEGDVVNTGDLVCVVEAMKMENEIGAHRAGTITTVAAGPGERVNVGTPLVVIE
jgi:acetyl-CoA/propionyl-CoA carboxylase biotin carboxyl carrier protein